MTFPRFTRGRSGNLTFDTMNEVFDRIEAIESSLGLSKPSKRDRLMPFLGKLGALKPQTTREWSFVEVTYPASLLLSVASPEVRGGRTSSDGTDVWAYPAVGDGLSPSQIVMLYPMNRDSSTVVGSPPDPRNGKLVYHAVPIPAQGRVARISGYTAIGTGRWRYQVQMVDLLPIGGSTENYIVPTGEPYFSAFNGAEAVSDAAGSYGVGSSPPGAVTSLTRNPIKVGVVVTLSIDRNGYWHFNVPNGYSVTC